VRLGTVRVSVSPWRDRLSHSGSRRIGCGHAGMWPPVHRPTRVYISDPRCSTKCLQGRWRRGMTSPAASPTALGRLAITGQLLGTPLGCWARRAQDRELVAVAVRPSPVWARRRWRGAVLATLPSARTCERVCVGVREAARTRKVNTTARVGVTARLGAGRDRASRRGTRRSPGPTPWVAASTASNAHECACGVRPMIRCVRDGQGNGVPPLGDRVRDLPGHGEAVAA
jgi:hypothetical protein